MPNQEPDIWQAQHVASFGATTYRFNNLFAEAPLRSDNGNIPVGEDVGVPDNPLVITAPYIVLSFAFPRDVEDPALDFTGKVRIYRRTRAFSRDHLDFTFSGNPTDPVVMVAEIDYGPNDLDLLGSIDRDTYDDRLKVIDQGEIEPGVIWYYTIFYQYEDVDKNLWWTFDPGHSHTRNWPYKQNYRADGENYSPAGDKLFSYHPRRLRQLDYLEHDNTLYRLCQSIGRVFDSIEEDLAVYRDNRADIDNMDFSRLPYIDWLLAWPTNYELGEDARRVETSQAVTLWKQKGTAAALELMLQTITGWDVRLVEGWPWVLHTADGRPQLDPAVPPVGWNEPEDGVWADLVNAVPYISTVDGDDPRTGASIGTSDDINTYTVSTEEVSSTGIGWPWQNPNGVLVILTNAENSPLGLPEVIIRKIHRMAPLFAAHYAAFSVIAFLRTLEQYQPFGDGYCIWEDQLIHVRGEVWQPFPPHCVAFDASPDKCLLHTYPHPEYPLASVLVSSLFVTPHSWLEFQCHMEEDDEPMPQRMMLADSDLVGQATPVKIVSQFEFDPTVYQAGRQFRLQVVGHIGGPTVGLNFEVRLRNLTDVVEVHTLTANAAQPAVSLSPPLSLGAGVGELAEGSRVYEIEIELENVANIGDFGHLGSVFLIVE